jgi:UDP-N-acetylmuramoyl-L-alanyl-D-glutamate--2,6-diaminopimelate ligase
MTLGQLLDGAQLQAVGMPSAAPDGGAHPVVAGRRPAAETRLSGLAYDSRAVRGGELFFCVGGFHHDGHEFAAQAVAAGAGALVVERPLALGVPEILVPSVRAAMAPLAASFYGHPSSELRVVGVTGTNGKTTITYLLRALLERAGVDGASRSCGLIGTVKSVIAGQERPVERTTPEAIDLQADLRAMLDGGDWACAMEVSSHALELGRADAISFAAAVFTNLTQDHLDFHASMEDYFLAKRALFLPAAGEPPARCVINIADPYGRRLAGELEGAITYSLDEPADYTARDIRCELGRCSFTLAAEGLERELQLPLPGRFNVANALAALATARALGSALEPLLEALEQEVRVPGRLEPVNEGQDFAVLVDYAHTPDSLANVLRAAREIVGVPAGEGGRVLCVFGAGGDRDRGKRPLMGEIAARLADEVIVTSDNPRSEDPEAIIAEIMAGVGEGAAVRTEPDRRTAIALALKDARAGDVLIIAGKGHEQGQELAGGRKLPFDDVTVAREALRALDGSRTLEARPR